MREALLEAMFVVHPLLSQLTCSYRAAGKGAEIATGSIPEKYSSRMLSNFSAVIVFESLLSQEDRVRDLVVGRDRAWEERAGREPMSAQLSGSSRRHQ